MGSNEEMHPETVIFFQNQLADNCVLLRVIMPWHLGASLVAQQ